MSEPVGLEPGKDLVSIAFIPKAENADGIMAGLLTCSLPQRLPIPRGEQWPGMSWKLSELTAAGTVQDFHLIPCCAGT